MIELVGGRKKLFRGNKRTKNKELLEELLVHFVDDIENGLAPQDAGWIVKEKIEVDDLYNLDLCEKDGERVRIVFRPLSKQVTKQISFEQRWLAEIHAEMIKAITIEKEITNLVADKNLHPAIVFLGWEKMLENSTFPVVVDRVVKEGISMDAWYTTIHNAAKALSLLILNKWCNTLDFETAMQQLGISIIEQTTQLDVEKIKRILSWNKVVTILNWEVAFALGVVWYVDNVLLTNDFQYSESIMYVQRKTWMLLAKNLKTEVNMIREKVRNVVEKIDATTSEKDKLEHFYPIANWDNIIRLPW